jgi:hypothetical protein
MQKPRLFDPIPIQVPKEKIYNRLGYKNNITNIPDKQKKEFESYIDEAFTLIKLKGAGFSVSVKNINSPEVTLSNGKTFKSKLLVKFIGSCRKVFFMGATSGEEIINSMLDAKHTNLTKRTVLDAVASEATDWALGWIQDYYNQELHRENKSLTPNRISCGYGDFLLKYQKDIYDMLNLKNIGVEITENFILRPEKSVTALSGICEVKNER